MPQTSHLESHDFALASISDRFTEQDIIQLLTDLVAQRGPLRGLKIFCDVTDAVPGGFGWKNMETAIFFVRQRIDDFAGARWATFAPGILNYGIARMAGQMLMDLPVEYQVFLNRELAYNWLAIPPALRPVAATATV